jgi:hypothetical protein
MRKLLASFVLLAAICSALIVGCEGPKSPTATGPQDDHTAIKETKGDRHLSTMSVINLLPTDVVLAGFTIHFNGRTVANNQTTFSYTVTGSGDQLHFRLELPTCAGTLASATPAGGVTSNNDALINPGIEWHPNSSSSTTSTFTFTLTYSGVVKPGIVLTSVKTTSASASGLIAGACARVFTISGSVFTDANSNALKESNETGLPGETVTLLDGSSNVLGSTTTSATGDYLFETLPAGNYAVRIDTATVTATSTTYISTTTPVFIPVTLGPDRPSVNFGVTPKSAKLINDLKFGILFTDGATTGFWKKQIQMALQGKTTGTVSKARLLTYLAQIDTFLLADPFKFPNGLLQSALDILNKPSNSDLDELRAQLLATELNHVSGHGIVSTDPQLQLVILEWCEALAKNAAPAGAQQGITPYGTASGTLTDPIGVCKSISSGGGTDF